MGVYVLIDCWKRKRQHDAEEREAQQQELQAKGLLDFDEPADEADTEPAGDDFWTEDGDAEATPEGDALRRNRRITRQKNALPASCAGRAFVCFARSYNFLRG